MDRAQGQLTLDDLGAPLPDVTFCVIDLETTGGSPTQCGITEIGAVKLRGGECLGTFQTLVNPGCAIPPEITVLTGITHSMVMPAPRIEQVLPALLEFVGEAVIVGHNVRFDVGFLQAALERDDRPRLTNRTVDTVALARRLVRDEVPNCKLGTLADRLRLDHKPSHRALDDALATGDLLHVLLERAGGLGVTGLDDLLALPTMAGHAQAAKLKLTDGLPRSPGVYVFRGARGEVLYVGKATNLRSRVRSYFSGDERRKIGALLRETQRIDHVVHPHPLSAAVHEVRLIHRFTPRYNRQSKDWSKYVYVKLTLDEAFPRLSVVKATRDDGCLYLGPLSSQRVGQRVIEAVQTAVPLRRCTQRVGRTPTRSAPVRLGPARRLDVPVRRRRRPRRVPQGGRAGRARPHHRAGAAPLTARRAAGRAGPGRALRGGCRCPRPGRGTGRGAAPAAAVRGAAPGRPPPHRGPRPGRGRHRRRPAAAGVGTGEGTRRRRRRRGPPVRRPRAAAAARP